MSDLDKKLDYLNKRIELLGKAMNSLAVVLDQQEKINQRVRNELDVLNTKLGIPQE